MYMTNEWVVLLCRATDQFLTNNIPTNHQKFDNSQTMASSNLYDSTVECYLFNILDLTLKD